MSSGCHSSSRIARLIINGADKHAESGKSSAVKRLWSLEKAATSKRDRIGLMLNIAFRRRLWRGGGVEGVPGLGGFDLGVSMGDHGY
jgi:hypothetical protein